MRVMMLGDVVGKAGREAVCDMTPKLRDRHKLDFVVVNGENAAHGFGINEKICHQFYDAGVYPDWWKLEPMKTDAAWQAACDAITRNDPYTRGIVVLGLAAAESALRDSFQVAARYPLVKGFAVGRTIFGAAAEAYMKDKITAGEAVDQMADNYARLCAFWDEARARAEEAA